MDQQQPLVAAVAAATAPPNWLAELGPFRVRAITNDDALGDSIGHRRLQ